MLIRLLWRGQSVLRALGRGQHLMCSTCRSLGSNSAFKCKYRCQRSRRLKAATIGRQTASPTTMTVKPPILRLSGVSSLKIGSAINQLLPDNTPADGSWAFLKKRLSPADPRLPSGEHGWSAARKSSSTSGNVENSRQASPPATLRGPEHLPKQSLQDINGLLENSLTSQNRSLGTGGSRRLYRQSQPAYLMYRLEDCRQSARKPSTTLGGIITSIVCNSRKVTQTPATPLMR